MTAASFEALSATDLTTASAAVGNGPADAPPAAGRPTARVAQSLRDAVAAAAPLTSGMVTEVRGLSITVQGIRTRVGDVVTVGEQHPIPTEVVAVQADSTVCLPLGPVEGIGAGDRAVAGSGPLTVAVGEQLLGRVLGGLGQPLDGSNLPVGLERVGIDHTPPDALTRARVDTPLPLGVRAIDTLAPIGRGQRMGIFAGSGVGKSSLLSMITRGTDADITVLALVGERGREVREFLEDDLGPEGLRRSVVVVATSDQPPMVRLRAAFVATRIAEWFRETGKHVLLLMDSVTRMATAQREIGLSAGEPPTTRGYPPSVFAMLPQLLERAGSSAVGSVTGLYTVLVEGGDHDEPVADAARSILDGHIVLDRKLANRGHFPSIDVLGSVSRVSTAVTSPDQRGQMTRLRSLLDAHADVKDLVEIGAYVSGTNAKADRALVKWPAIEHFLQQPKDEIVPVDSAWQQLDELLADSAEQSPPQTAGSATASGGTTSGGAAPDRRQNGSNTSGGLAGGTPPVVTMGGAA